ncbi:MAG: glycerol-3-phosphate ABC transporter permease [Treponema sp. CETP13]|nr:MAG: glycerol-3-phosphate ABC transporter permease [Treponema sp. CETP13]
MISKLKTKQDPIWIHVILLTAVFFITFPLFFTVVKSTQSLVQVTTPSLRIGSSFGSNLATIWNEYHMHTYMINSLFYAIVIASGKIILSLFAANALVFFKFKGKKIVFGFIIITLMFPVEILILGLFSVVSNAPASNAVAFFKWFLNPVQMFTSPVAFGFGMGDTKAAVVFPFLASATGVFLFRQHFLSIPVSICDAAKMDGTNSFQFLVKILIPMSANTIGALTLIQFVYVWDQYIWPRIIIQHNSAQVIQVGLNAIMSAGDSIEWNLVMTGALVTIIPSLIVFVLLYKAFMSGYALSSNK